MIHYHGLPLTPLGAMLGAMRARHCMVSYAEPKQITTACEVCQSVALDNGAFSAWRGGYVHDLDGYQAWCELWLRHPSVDWCVIPDVIDGSEKQNDDLLGVWELGRARCVPVFHMHESLARLERLMDEWPRVALGSSGAFADPGAIDWWGRMAEIMRVACDADGMPRVPLHGLRMLDPVIFAHLPLASADSCAVARNVGLDSKWSGPFVPRTRLARALVLIDRIESHASARRWCESAGVQQNLELIG